VLTYKELVKLERSLRRESVLSIYIDGAAHDPAAQRGWRVSLDAALRDLRTASAFASRGERAAFQKCLQFLDDLLADRSGALGATGWVGFFTALGARHAEALPVPMPTLATWRVGATVAPYVRALKQNRPAIVAVVDDRSGHLFRYQGGTLTRLESVRAEPQLDHVDHMGDAPREKFHPGVHGTTARDEAQRDVREATDRMTKDLANRIGHLSHTDAWVLICGTTQATHRLRHLLPRPLAERARTLQALDVRATEAEIATAAAEGVSQARNEMDRAHIEHIAGRAGERARTTIGANDTTAALEQTRVLELYVTHRFLLEHSARADEMVRASFDQGASVEEVSGAAAERLDELGGVGARLRYPLDPVLGVRHLGSTRDERARPRGEDGAGAR
jgi:hypothetical protein